MSLSDKLRFWDQDKDKNKDKDDSAPKEPVSNKPVRRTPPPVPPTPPAPAALPAKSAVNPQDVSQQIEKEKQENAAKLKGRDKDVQDVRLNLDKLDLEAKNRREEHQQTSQMMRMDAEREIKYLERKLQEDAAAWSKQLAEREKALEQAAQLSESGHVEKKAAFDKESKERQEALIQTETALREQQAKLSQERQKWQELLRTKDAELVTLRQELSRREGALEEELKSQEAQQKAAKELWETRLRELEKQWADKRKAWEDAMKATEDERLRLQNSFQERQGNWQLDQERRLQEIARREERATEKLGALQAHFTKEAQTWKQMAHGREEQVKELRVKLLLSETDVKGRAEQAQRLFQEKVVTIAQQVQTLQSQLNDEQTTWQKALDAKESEINSLKDQIQNKLRQMESEYAQRMSALTAQKEHLHTDLEALKTQQKDQQQASDERLTQLKAEQDALEGSVQQRLSAIQKAADQETLRLQGEIQKLEQQKDIAEKDVQALRQKSQEEQKEKDDLLKAVQASLAEQEAALRVRFAPDEENLTRQVEALKTRNRALDRDITRLRENIDRSEKDHAAALIALQSESQIKEEDLEKRCVEQEEKLKKRFEERKLSLDAFLVMKKDEETRLQTHLKTKEKERAELNARLENLPKLFEEEAKKKRETAKKDIEQTQKLVEAAEQQQLQIREQSKTAIQARASQLGALRQSLEAKQKELAGELRTKEQIWASERAGVEKQLSAAQAEMDRVRVHWQSEITKKEQDAKALEDEIRRQETLHRQALEREEKVLADQIAPLEKQRQDISRVLEQERLAHDQQLRDFEKQSQDTQIQIQQAVEQSRADEKTQEAKFRDERARFKAQIESLKSEQDAVGLEGKNTVGDRAIQIEQLEEQVRQQAVAHETRKRELIHGATLKSRTLQDMLSQLDLELKSARETFPVELKAREEALAQLTVQLAKEQERYQKLVARYERAFHTLSRRGHQKEEALRIQLVSVKEDWTKKLAGRDAEIAALQADLLAKEAERQGELDRLAKQFAEERFQLEKSKEELEWKLKDHKEVSERQLAGREKEIRFLESEISRVKVQRDQQLTQKAAAFEVDKQKIQTALNAMETQLEQERRDGETTLAAKERDIQTMIARSKKQLSVLGDEFNQKVNSWRSTNDALRGQIEQLKLHWAQAQDHWDTLRKEKAAELSTLRQELHQWEAKIQNDVQILDRTHDQDRQSLLAQLRKKEKELEEAQTLFQRRMADKEDDLNRATEEIRDRESGAETQWTSSLQQWQSDKQNLDQEKVHLEQELLQLQSRSEREHRELEETIGQLRVEVTFKESQTQSQQERLKTQYDKDLQPLRDQIAHLTGKLQQEKASWETKLQSKESDIKITKTRLAWREKRLQDEIARRQKELSGLQQAAADELRKAQARYAAEKLRLEGQLKERRSTLAALQAQQGKQRQSQTSGEAQTQKSLQTHRLHLEDSIQKLEAQYVDLARHYEALLADKVSTLAELETMLASKDGELQDTRQKARVIGDKLRKDMDTSSYNPVVSGAPKSGRAGPVWAIFEQAIQRYKAEQWTEAAGLFQDCVRQDPNWSAAYQYLALVYHALGQESDAAWAAEQALEKDPDNTRLSAWANTLRATLQVKQPPAA